jgi:hypothetical protein
LLWSTSAAEIIVARRWGTVVTLRYRFRRPAVFASGHRHPRRCTLFSAAFHHYIGADGAIPCVRAAGPVDISAAGDFADLLRMG